MTKHGFRLVAGFTALLSFPGCAIAGEYTYLWDISSVPRSGHNFSKVCLANQEGGWIERDAEKAANCEEMLIADRDSRWLWPDKSFYQGRDQSRSSVLFTYSNVNGPFVPNKDAILQVMQESGALRRLESEVAAQVKSSEQMECETEYAEANTEEALGMARIACPNYFESEARASSRILEAKRAKEQNSLLEKEEHDRNVAKATRPWCTSIRFSGIAVGATASDLDVVEKSRDVQELLAVNPLHCTPNGFTQTYTCIGGANFVKNKGYIIGWNEKAYRIIAPVDLYMGRKDSMLFVRRSDAHCSDHIRPSLDFRENMIDFLKNHNYYR